MVLKDLDFVLHIILLQLKLLDNCLLSIYCV